MKNIFENIPKVLKEELFENIIDNKGIRIERIVSDGQATPQGEWLIQDMDEWVILLSGYAELSFDDAISNIKMKPGDYIFIKASQRHRVDMTSLNKKTVWLAVHLCCDV
ncbi:MAG: cupin domain-containing protein [Candidatus Omnitrophica bacterium]|nr:cupin domain-containing protein [Candidatus Omnitrophota bacterium]